VNAAYRRKYFASTPNLVSHVIESMVTSGLYNRHVDLQFATASLLSMLTAPLFNMSDKAGISDRLKSAAWIDHVSMMMDLAFCTGSSRQQP
jgi:hypothetical protein